MVTPQHHLPTKQPMGAGPRPSQQVFFRCCQRSAVSVPSCYEGERAKRSVVALETAKMSNKLFPEKRQTMLALLHTMPDLHWKSTALDNQMYMDQHNMWSSQRLGQSEYECLGSSKGKNKANDEEIDPADTTNEDKQMVFIESFLQNNRLENLHQVMGYHPRYLEAFVKTQNYLLRDDGPLPFPYRHYIALMAAARHQCVYLVRLHAQEFLLQGGDAQWLRGLEYAPQKLRNLCEVNNILAHRPWLLNKNHIEKLTRGNDTWSLSEMMQALIIIAHFHSLCSFIMGCGLAPEIDQGGCTTRNASSSGDDESEDYSSDSSVGGEMNANVLEEDSLESLMQRMKELTESTHEEEPTQEELLKRFELVENQSSEISVPTKEKTSKKEEVLRFVTNSDFTYNDFAKRAPGLDIPTFRIQDYSWEDHAFSLANRLYSDIGNLLDDRFNIAFNLTYYTMGDIRSVDTSAFRQAIWYYIHCMYGIRHDDYDYAQVNQLLERNLKTYIKTVCCFPERITKKDYEGVMKGFKHSEKVHVNMMITEARMQAELLYALRAVNHYMT